MASNETYVLNVAYTVPINPPSVAPVLTEDDFYKGLVRGARKPHEMSEYVADTYILPETDKPGGFRRRLTLADGSVHSKKGEEVVQDVRLVDGLHVEATTIDTGARTSILMSRSGESTADGPDCHYLTAIYELVMPGVTPGSQQAADITKNYSSLAKGAASTAVRVIREWKVSGKLDE